MDFLLVATAVLGGASLGLMLKNMLSQKEAVGAVKVELPSGDVSEVLIDGRRVVPIAYAAVGYTGKPSRSSGESLARLARSMGLSVTFISSHLRLRKDKLLREIESEIQKAEMAYSSTRMLKYRERLKFLESLYTEVSRMHVPYASGFSIIVWVPSNNPDAVSEAEAFRAIVEAELGVKLERVELKSLRDLADLLAYRALPGPESQAPVPAPRKPPSPNGLVLGRKAGDPSTIVMVEWPKDLESHGAIIGPTGKGKTVLLAGLSAQLALRFGVNVTVVDPKGDLSRLLGGIADHVTRNAGEPLREGLVVYNLEDTPPSDKGPLAASIVDMALTQAYSGSPRRVLVLDEAWRVLDSNPSSLEAAVREGRSLGLHLVYAVQTPHDIPVTVLENTRFYTVFGAPGRDYTEALKSMGFEGVEGLLPKMNIGEAIVKASGEAVHTILIDFSKYLKTPSDG